MNTHTSILAKLSLFGATLIWGSSFVLVKNTVDVLPPAFLLAIRFTIGFLILGIVFYKNLRKIDKAYLWQGAIIGLCLFLAYTIQTFAIIDTTPGKNAFLTAVYCVIVPFLFWLVDKNKPDIYNVLAAFVCIMGIGMVSLTNNLTIGIGDIGTLIGGFFFAAHIVAVAKFGKGKDPIIITILQFGYCAIFSWILTFFIDDISSVVVTGDIVGGMAYLSVGCTAIALLLQNIGQKYTHPASASIILSLESVFGVIFSVILYGEVITKRLFIGFVLIFLAIIISETKLSFLEFNKNKDVSLYVGETSHK